MLQLSSRSIHRLGSSYICASCLVVSRSPRLLSLHPTSIPRYHSRSITSTPRRTATSSQTTTPTEHDASSISPSPAQETSKRRRRDKDKKSPKKADTSTKAPLSKKAASQNEDAHQLQVLQGALQALKNVLTAQNIKVDQISKSTKQTKQANPDSKVKTKTKVKAKPKSSTKPPKAGNETTPASKNATEKGDSEKSAKPKDDKSPKSTAAASLATSKSEPTSSKARVGRLRRSRSTRTKEISSTEPIGSARSRPEKSRVLKSHGIGSHAALRESLRKLSENDEGVSELTEPLPVSGEVRGPYQIIGQPFSGEQPPNSKPRKEKRPSVPFNTISTQGLKTIPIETERLPVPTLSYGLERVLFNPGVYHLQDPRSKVYNFDPYLSEIMPIQEFDFNALKQYVTSSKDSTLIRIAKEHGKKYTGSTSSMTSMLSHFHFLLSSWREISVDTMSRKFKPDSVRFTRIMRAPSAVFLHWKDGTYAIDADKEFDTANILSMLGKSMEKLLTVSREEYERYRHINSDQITEEERNAEEAFHYTGFNDFMLRSQLDAYDPRVPGTGMFDLKTRAVVSIRMDAKGFQKGLGYEIRNRFGQWESFEREYYDMIRSAFLKYSLQVRMGRMDGIFVAFHNTQRIFGFQYIPLEEMDFALHGTYNKTLGNKEYKLSLSLLNEVFDRAAKRFPGQSLRMHFETRTSVSAPFMYIFAKPVTQEDIDEVQNAGKASVEAFERDMLGIGKEEANADPEPVAENDDVVDEDEDVEESSTTQQMSSLTAWEEVRQMVEDAVDDDELGVGAVREAIEDSLEQSGLLRARSSTETREYIDALLSAMTSDNSSEAVELVASKLIEENTAAEEGELPTASLSNPDSDLETPKDELATEQPQLDEGREEFIEILDSNDQPNIEDKDYSKSTTQPETDVRHYSENAETTELPGEQTQEADQAVNTTAAEELPITESSINTAALEESSNEEAQKGSKAIEKEVEEEEEDETDDADAEVEIEDSKRGSNAASSMSPLKDLIVKMARRIDEKDVLEEDDSPLDSSSKLKEFERILGELIARSKDEHAYPQENDISSEPDEPTEPQTEEYESIESQLEKAGKAHKPASESSPDKAAKTAEEDIGDPNLLGMVLTIKNKVNYQYVTRPENLSRSDDWRVEYNIQEIKGSRAQTIYQQCKTRRRKVFEDTGDRDSEWYKMFRGNLQQRTESGRRFRASETAKAKIRPVHIVGHDKPLTWDDVFGKSQQQNSTSGKADSAKEDDLEADNENEDDNGNENGKGEKEGKADKEN